MIGQRRHADADLPGMPAAQHPRLEEEGPAELEYGEVGYLYWLILGHER
jgi:hypothetical protein